MKLLNTFVTNFALMSITTFANAEACRVVEDADELASLRQEAQVAGNYAQGWLLEKHHPESGSFRCEPNSDQVTLGCYKNGKAAFLSINRNQELVSGVVLKGEGKNEFSITQDGRFECMETKQSDGAVSDTDTASSAAHIILTFKPETNKDGLCQPERIDTVNTHIDGKRLREIRGDASYFTPIGSTSIPFQSVHKYPKQNGVSISDAIIGLNQNVACKDVTINLKIKSCKYVDGTRVSKGRCPDIKIKGAADFAAINLDRRD